jgi:hypothetical protein
VRLLRGKRPRSVGDGNVKVCHGQTTIPIGDSPSSTEPTEHSRPIPWEHPLPLVAVVMALLVVAAALGVASPEISAIGAATALVVGTILRAAIYRRR